MGIMGTLPTPNKCTRHNHCDVFTTSMYLSWFLLCMFDRMQAWGLLVLSFLWKMQIWEESLIWQSLMCGRDVPVSLHLLPHSPGLGAYGLLGFCVLWVWWLLVELRVGKSITPRETAKPRGCHKTGSSITYHCEMQTSFLSLGSGWRRMF